MVFESLVTVSKKLEVNLRTLEDELRHASTFIYEGLDQSETSRKGVNLLESLVEKWEVVCNELEIGNAKEEEEVKELEEDLEQYKKMYDELKKTQSETETVLAEKNILELCSSQQLLNSTPSDVNVDSVSPFANSFSLPHHQLQTSTPSGYDSETTVYEPPK